jgi:hypothetical protein
MRYPARPLALLTAALLTFVANTIVVNNLILTPVTWRILLYVGAAGLTTVGILRHPPRAVRATVAVLVAVTLTARAIGLLLAFFDAEVVTPAELRLLTAAAVWPVVAAQTVVLLAHWSFLTADRR